MTQRNPTDLLPPHDERPESVDGVPTQPTVDPLRRHRADAPPKGVATTPSPSRRRVRFAALAAAVVVLFAIATSVVVLRTGDAPVDGTRSGAQVHPNDWHLENQARRLDASGADTDRFAGRYSDRAERDSAQPPMTQLDRSDTHLRNQAQKVQDDDPPRRRPGLAE
jgi:hypothetical protein